MGMTHASPARKAGAVLIAALGWLVASRALPQGLPPPTITVHLSSFAFTPDRLLLRAGVAVKLHLVNDSSRGHDFSAPALFAASTVLAGTPPDRGSIEVGGDESRDIVFVPRQPGTYKLRCTHFLHSFFGMTGRVVVLAPPR
jgi:plastocyanin